MNALVLHKLMQTRDGVWKNLKEFESLCEPQAWRGCLLFT